MEISLEVVDKILIYLNDHLNDQEWHEYKDLANNLDLGNENIDKVIEKMVEMGLVELDEETQKIKATDLGSTSVKTNKTKK
ncbi:hypothetical protein [Methanonatronarchaeum thermophilum]|uniref:hypothetical protein n=1 Tax=Methanonatronarchaeum thermophilum TaxID=1927129 RepID=UPI00117B3C28|nr:hypothetical protein [Methanonatronarchaeum thermophilum]